MKYCDIPLPEIWPKRVKSIILHAISLAQQNAALLRKAAAGLSHHSSPWRDDGGYNEFRPHQGIKGKTPVELYSGISHAPPKFNIRDPNLKLNLYGAQSAIHVAYLHERPVLSLPNGPHLPIISLKRAA